MRAVVQRVKSSSVVVDGQIVGSIGRGLNILLAVSKDDQEEDSIWLADKIAGLRIFPDGDNKMNLSLQDIQGEILVVSQFTLYGDCRKGRRPSFVQSASKEKGESLYLHFIQQLKAKGFFVATGSFGAMMDVEILNWGPVTLIIDSPPKV
ncbi:MAG: D-tyrosyl-tRNA(Tyr) deacylase [Planctomycetota bacterium]|nr:MAG: D-tyrosyl-tRNA(Tyr) deacylase [Planctomycetota bacterium]